MPVPPSPEITTADSAEGDSTTALYQAAVGTVNASYYIPVFTRFEATDRLGPGWNWAAALCTLNWMAYRQLWSAALAYAGAVVGVALLVFGIGRLVFQLSEPAQLALVAALVVAAFVVPGVAGNAIFYAHCRKKMAAALAANSTLPQACAMLAGQASSRQRMLWLALANAAAVGAAVSGYLAFPQAGQLPHPVPVPAEARSQVIGKPVDLPPTSSAVAVLPALDASAPAPAASEVSVPVASPAPAASAPIGVVTKPPEPPAKAPDSALSVAVAPKAAASAAALAPAAVAQAKPKKSAKPGVEKRAKKPPSPPVANEPRYFINVGLFADGNNARNATVKLTDAGLPAFKEELETKKGKRTRVRVGPFGSAPEADQAAEKIRALGLDALLLKQ